MEMMWMKCGLKKAMCYEMLEMKYLVPMLLRGNPYLIIKQR